MANPKLRKLLINLHLLFAAFMAPVFILLAVTGGNYLLGNKGSVSSEPVALNAGAALDFKSATLKSDVEAIISANGIDHTFEYIKNRGNLIQTRPTSRPYLQFEQSEEGLKAYRKTPNLQSSLMELHKGHGPRLFKTYQKLVALGLIGVVLGGFLVGLLAPGYRRRTIIATVAGTGLFVLLAFIL